MQACRADARRKEKNVIQTEESTEKFNSYEPRSFHSSGTVFPALPRYCLLDPTGNITILAGLPVGPEQRNDLPGIAASLMEKEPSAEQVGFLGPGDGNCDLSLTMAGGEFCGNATMSAAAVFLASREPAEALTAVRILSRFGSPARSSR